MLWTSLEEGLYGVLMYAQQGLEGLNLPAVSQAIGESLVGVDVPEIPDLTSLGPFGLFGQEDSPPDSEEVFLPVSGALINSTQGATRGDDVATDVHLDAGAVRASPLDEHASDRVVEPDVPFFLRWLPGNAAGGAREVGPAETSETCLPPDGDASPGEVQESGLDRHAPARQETRLRFVAALRARLRGWNGDAPLSTDGSSDRRQPTPPKAGATRSSDGLDSSGRVTSVIDGTVSPSILSAERVAIALENVEDPEAGCAAPGGADSLDQSTASATWRPFMGLSMVSWLPTWPASPPPPPPLVLESSLPRSPHSLSGSSLPTGLATGSVDPQEALSMNASKRAMDDVISDGGDTATRRRGANAVPGAREAEAVASMAPSAAAHPPEASTMTRMKGTPAAGSSASSNGERRRTGDAGASTPADAAAACANPLRAAGVALSESKSKVTMPPSAWWGPSREAAPAPEPAAPSEKSRSTPATGASKTDQAAVDKRVIDALEGGADKTAAVGVNSSSAEEDTTEEWHAFGDVKLAVTRIPPPPEMEITVNARSGTPAEAAARPAAAVAAKAAAESEKAQDEWVDGDPIESHMDRTRDAVRPPLTPLDLTGLTGEIRLVEMACLAGLSAGSSKTAGRVMHEQIGFEYLLRGLRNDVRPSLRRRVLQAISTLVDSDPSLAPCLLGLEDDASQRKAHRPPDDIGRPAGISGGGESSSSSSSSSNNGVIRKLGRLLAVFAGSSEGAAAVATAAAAAAVTEPAGAPRDTLLSHLKGIMALSSAGFSGGVSSPSRTSGVARFRRALRRLVPRSPAFALLRMTSRVRPRVVTTAATTACADPAAVLRKVARRDGEDLPGAADTDSEVTAEEGDWWRDDAGSEDGEVDEPIKAAGAWRGWWWCGRDRVSRERLVEEALELTLRLVMSGDRSLDVVRGDAQLIDAVRRVADGTPSQRLQYDSSGILRRVGPPLSHSQQLANKVLAACGAHDWVPKTQGQKGIRILCFDGGGTRGVLTVALMKHIERALGGRQPHEVFDMIVGTSTGGIVAGLAGVQRLPVSECERLYDTLIGKIFVKHPAGGMKLALKQAFYDEVGWMAILEQILGDVRMLDTAADPLRPLIACPSTLVSSNPARLMLWRNYNYPPGHRGRYYGSFRHMVRQAIRATTAAPTFFAPLMLNGALYSDGALLCNNPSAVAVHEAKHAFPGVPIEMIVSLGTGCFFEEKKVFMEPSVGWDGIINQVIASATETEITTDVVTDLLPRDQYFRFNPRMKDMPIDEVRKEKLDWLKVLADEYFEVPENRARLEEMAQKMMPSA